MMPVHASPDRHYGCRMNGHLYWQGMRALLMQNEALQILILLDKGAEIVQFLYKALDVDFLWRGPRPLTAPSSLSGLDREAPSSFFDQWSGGWFEVLPNGGPACSYRGTPLGFFGETTGIPWQFEVLEDHPERVSVRLWVRTRRLPFLLEKTLTLESRRPVLLIEERVSNEGKEALDFMWGHHPVLGAPFLDASCRLCAPDSRVEVLHDEDGPDYRMELHQVGRWPRIRDRHGQPLDLREIPGPEVRSMDNCYLSEFAEGWIAVASPRLDLGFGLAWDAAVFRYIWLWQAFGGGLGYPWFGRTYNIGIEPWTSFPCAGLSEAIDRGTAMQIEPGASLCAWLTATAFTGVNEVKHISREGKVTAR